MKVYLDVCCYNRPFDDQTQERIRLEAEATAIVMTGIRLRFLELIDSEAVDLEHMASPFPERDEAISPVRRLASVRVELQGVHWSRARLLSGMGFGRYDALHVACAEAGGADVLLTTDDQFLRVAARERKRLHVRVVNPVEWVNEAKQWLEE